jgi:copper chaperone CopZ
METLTIELPAMYADHHVSEVRRILLEIPGVSDVYASSAFHVAEISFDPATIVPELIYKKLEEAGYLGSLPIPVEAGASVYLEEDKQGYFRHTAVYENVRQVVSFSQQVSYSGRPLWPCPGMGPIRSNNVVEE